ncbi:hypothetical protein F4561_000607 [Lipingzhangella halophila]|uniref:DUF4245 domain-containing protein n=1 Tax=Lipingzhangella halophila TaxID=1783352 RepID=A0A7W7W0D1_9ACTN|nr:DUF4245 domain-containing protein [Lipingzhangella halophila]MBB4929787.1 hypothetical protein [Lipingzhangella halophila]
MSNYSRADATFGAYAAALGLLVAVLLVMAFVVSARNEEHIPRVDYGSDAQELSRTAEYTVLVPEDLPEGWVPTSSRLDAEDGQESGGAAPAAWTLGFATPEDMHARVSMSDAEPERFVARTTEHGDPDGESEIGDATWERYLNEGEEQRSLVRADEGGATVVVTGSADYKELETLAGSLRPRE